MDNSNIKVFAATKAFINYQRKVLIIKESDKYPDGTSPGKFDVVGGRVKPGQKFDENLLREIKEETGLEVTIGKPFMADEWRPTVKGESWQIVCIYFECFTQSNKVILGKDHCDYQWIDPKEHKKYNLIEDIHPIFEAYLNK